MNESIHYLNPPGDMTFARRLATTRKHAGLTQQALADTIGIHVTQLLNRPGFSAQRVVPTAAAVGG